MVTHDQDEAMALASRIAVMDRGRVLQVGTPAEIYEFPASRFVAEFVGTANVFESAVLERRAGLMRLYCADAACELLLEDAGQPVASERVWLALRPEKIRLSKDPPAGGEPMNVLRGSVWELGYLGNRSTYRIRIAGGKLITVVSQNARRTSEWAIDWGDEVYVSWSADAGVLLPD